MDPKLVSAYEEIASGHKKLAEYYSSLAISSASLSPVVEEPTQKAEKTPKSVGKKEKDPDAPKRPMSSFLIFANERRPAMKEAHPEWNYQDLTRELGILWKSADHKVYEEKAAALMDGYRAQKVDYLKSKGSSEEPSTVVSPQKKQKKERKPKTESESPAPSQETLVAAVASPVKTQASPQKTVSVVQPESPLKENKEPVAAASGEVQEKKKKKKHKHIETPAEAILVPASQTSVAAETSDEFAPQPKKVKKRKHEGESLPVTA